MKQILFKFLFSVSSFSWVLLFLLVNNKFNIPNFNLEEKIWSYNVIFFEFLKYLLLFLIVIWFAKLILFLSIKYLKEWKKWETSTVSKIKPIEWVFLPIYIWLFVIALSFNSITWMDSYFLIGVLFLFWLLFENISYFNPFFLFFWYNFYEVETKDWVTVILILKRSSIKNTNKIEKLIRINDFTFLQY